MNEESENKEKTVKIELSEKYTPLLYSLQDVWECQDLNDVLKKSVLLMTYLTGLRQEGAKFYVQEKNGNSREVTLFKSDDINEDFREAEKSSLEDLKNCL